MKWVWIAIREERRTLPGRWLKHKGPLSGPQVRPRRGRWCQQPLSSIVLNLSPQVIEHFPAVFIKHGNSANEATEIRHVSARDEPDGTVRFSDYLELIARSQIEFPEHGDRNGNLVLPANPRCMGH